jgi:hypothetical protein
MNGKTNSQLTIFTASLAANEIAKQYNQELFTYGFNKSCHRVGQVHFKGNTATIRTFQVMYHSHGRSAVNEVPPEPPLGWNVICDWIAWYWEKEIIIDTIWGEFNSKEPVVYDRLCCECNIGHKWHSLIKNEWVPTDKITCIGGFNPGTIQCANWFEKAIHCLDYIFLENSGCLNALEDEGCHKCYEEWLNKHSDC